MMDWPNQEWPASFSFHERPLDVAPDLRTNWLLCAICLVLGISSWGKKSSHPRLLVMVWALLNESTMQQFKALLDGSLHWARFPIRYDPTIARAIDIAAGLGLVNWNGGDRIALADVGIDLVEAIKSQGGFKVEREFLSSIKSSFGEARSAELIARRPIL